MERFELSRPKALTTQVSVATITPHGQLWSPGTESNRRHQDLQSRALPTELPGDIMVGKCGYAPLPVKDEFYRLAAETISFTFPYFGGL